MSRWLLALLVLGLALHAQKPAPRKPEPAAAKEQEPPEEDESVKKKEYTFNPLQAAKEVQIGNFYFKKGSYRAAAQRFREATQWNAGLADAWLRLAETQEKLKDPKAAREAYAKYLELAPDAKNADEIRIKINKK
jgi:outer membrane protein assembly factor BamD (BamD/ComL family)